MDDSGATQGRPHARVASDLGSGNATHGRVVEKQDRYADLSERRLLELAESPTTTSQARGAAVSHLFGIGQRSLRDDAWLDRQSACVRLMRREPDDAAFAEMIKAYAEANSLDLLVAGQNAIVDLQPNRLVDRLLGKRARTLWDRDVPTRRDTRDVSVVPFAQINELLSSPLPRQTERVKVGSITITQERLRQIPGVYEEARIVVRMNAVLDAVRDLRAYPSEGPTSLVPLLCVKNAWMPYSGEGRSVLRKAYLDSREVPEIDRLGQIFQWFKDAPGRVGARDAKEEQAAIMKDLTNSVLARTWDATESHLIGMSMGLVPFSRASRVLRAAIEQVHDRRADYLAATRELARMQRA